MDTVERIKQQIADSMILIYMKGTPDMPQCGFSAQTVQALKACGAQFDYVNILEHPDIRQTLTQVANWPTFPQLYINGELIGGCDIVMELYKTGELQQQIESATVK